MTATAPASTTAVAEELVALCRVGRNLDAIDKLYSPHIVSIESRGDATMPAEMSGIDAVRGKNIWWLDNHEVHKAEVNGPFLGKDQFSVHYSFEVTFKPTGQRNTMVEMALYTVRDGKVVREQFFYYAPSA